MSEASIQALKMQIETGKLETDAAHILNFIKNRTVKEEGTCLVDLENTYTFRVATIVARLSGLEDKGLIFKKGTQDIIQYKGTIDQRTVKYTNYYHEPNEFAQSRRRDEIKNIKMRQTAKSLLTRFGGMLSENLKQELVELIK